jgi:hypothetical protein
VKPCSCLSTFHLGTERCIHSDTSAELKGYVYASAVSAPRNARASATEEPLWTRNLLCELGLGHEPLSRLENCNVPQSYSWIVRLQFGLGHRLCSMKFFGFYSVLPGKFWNSTSILITPLGRILPKSFLINNLLIVLPSDALAHGYCSVVKPNDRASDRRLLVKLVPTFADIGCRVVSETDPPGR